MASNVNLWVTNWAWTGSNIPTPQATANVTLQWIDNSGQAHEWIGVLTFPNDLADVPVAWIKEEVTDLMLRVARKKLGID